MTGRDHEIVERLIRTARERDRLARHIEILNAKLLELSADHVEPRQIRDAYRRGYRAGRAAKRRGAPDIANPEVHARGWVRQALAGEPTA